MKRSPARTSRCFGAGCGITRHGGIFEGLAAAFGVPPNFFFDQTAAEEIAAKLELLASMRDAGVQRVALRASELSPDGLRAIQSMVEHVRRIEGLPAEDD